MDDEQHCLLHCLDPVLCCTREALIAKIRQEVPATAMNVEQDLYQVLAELDNVVLRHMCVRFMALCHKVAERS